MRKKTQKVVQFLSDLHDFIINHPQFRQKTASKSETQIQTELRPLIVNFLEKYFEELGYVDYIAKANSSFYWEGQEGELGRDREMTFGSRNYPDFIITEPYIVAIEYKQSPYGTTIKHGIGQSIMHTLSGDYKFVYFLFNDQSKGKIIVGSFSDLKESVIIKRMWDEYNVFIRAV